MADLAAKLAFPADQVIGYFGCADYSRGLLHRPRFLVVRRDVTCANRFSPTSTENTPDEHP
jgi:hypothetical protein